jgi:hypothetical protein
MIAQDLQGRIAAFRPPVLAGSMYYYLGTYQKFLDVFGQLTFASDAKEESDFCVWLVASWMRLQKDEHWSNYKEGLANYEAALPSLRRARAEPGLVLPDDLDIIKGYVGGSMVAASKFLHFVAPERYAMWDRNVWAAITGRPKSSFQDCAKAYSCYLGHLSEFTLPVPLDEQLQCLLGGVTSLRRKEFVLFCLGRG